MRKLLSSGFLAASLMSVAATSASAGPLVITTGLTAQELVDLLVALNPGITVLSATYTGDPIASGSFTNGTPVLPFAEGIVMTTGQASFAANNDNTDDGITGVNTGGSDADLAALSGFDIEDAAILEFTFEAVSPTISFQYAFASDEYNEFVGLGVNDAFGFFLNGTNLAVVPGTNDPITIDTVNCTLNSSFFINNDDFDDVGDCSEPSANLPFEYDGLVGAGSSMNWLFATGTVNTGPGNVNTIKLAIGDGGDDLLDSAVFLKAGSFVNEPPTTTTTGTTTTGTTTATPTTTGAVPEPGTLGLLVLALAGLVARRRCLH